MARQFLKEILIKEKSQIVYRACSATISENEGG